MSLATSVSVFSDLDGLLERSAHGGRDARQADRLQQLVQVADESQGSVAHRAGVVGVVGQVLDGGDQAVEVVLERPDDRVELVLGALRDGFRARVRAVRDLLTEPFLCLVEGGLQALRLGDQLGDGVQGVRHERWGSVEELVLLEEIQQAEESEQLGEGPGQERVRVELAVDQR